MWADAGLTVPAQRAAGGCGFGVAPARTPGPRCEYQRYQLTSYVEAQAAGERVELVPRALVPGCGPDFWLFDQGTAHARAVLMHYHGDGRLDRRELVVDTALIERLGTAAREAGVHAVPLNEFLASRKTQIA